ncbi:MAG: 23S rRNA (uracil(1939)-C(5))-methyltransferase RlmD [Burkholderiales bacterium]
MTLEIESLDAEGRGVARNAEGKVVFVEGALTGERVEVQLLHRKPKFDLARTVAVVRESSSRRAPRCRYFGVCGGCATQHIDARTQLAAKQRWLEDCLQRIGKVKPETVLPMVYGEEWGYRRRARLTVRRVAKKGGVLVGFHERHSSYVVDMLSCEVLPPRISRLIPRLRALVESLSIRQRLPQIELAMGDAADALVFRNLDPLEAGDEQELREFAQQEGVSVWLQPSGPDSAHAFHPLPAPSLDYVLPEYGLRIAFRPTDFTQVNHGVNRVLVSRAVRLLDPQPGERIGDLFCGLGNFSLPLARMGAQVLGLEGSATLVERARENAAANGLRDLAGFDSADLYGAGAGGFAARGPFDKLLIDPPRSGAVEAVKALPEAWPRRIVYVSCDPATLARDAGALVHAKGFRLVAAGVVNMFPHTVHVESIALFERP